MNEQPLAPPPGKPMFAADIAREVFANVRSPKWVLRHCPAHRLSRCTVIFYEAEVRAWVASNITRAA